MPARMPPPPSHPPTHPPTPRKESPPSSPFFFFGSLLLLLLLQIVCFFHFPIDDQWIYVLNPSYVRKGCKISIMLIFKIIDAVISSHSCSPFFKQHRHSWYISATSYEMVFSAFTERSCLLFGCQKFNFLTDRSWGFLRQCYRVYDSLGADD